MKKYWISVHAGPALLFRVDDSGIIEYGPTYSAEKSQIVFKNTIHFLDDNLQGCQIETATAFAIDGSLTLGEIYDLLVTEENGEKNSGEETSNPNGTG